MPLRPPVATCAADRKLLREIKTAGWTLMYVSGDPSFPNFGFTIGLFANFSHPEIVLVGIDPGATGRVLNRIAERIRDGTQFDDVHEFPDVLANQYKCRFRTLTKKLCDQNLGTAIWFYQGAKFPALQAFIPDVNGRFPWDRAFHGNATAQFFIEDPLRTRIMRTARPA